MGSATAAAPRTPWMRRTCGLNANKVGFLLGASGMLILTCCAGMPSSHPGGRDAQPEDSDSSDPPLAPPELPSEEDLPMHVFGLQQDAFSTQSTSGDHDKEAMPTYPDHDRDHNPALHDGEVANLPVLRRGVPPRRAMIFFYHNKHLPNNTLNTIKHYRNGILLNITILDYMIHAKNQRFLHNFTKNNHLTLSRERTRRSIYLYPTHDKVLNNFPEELNQVPYDMALPGVSLYPTRPTPTRGTTTAISPHRNWDIFQKDTTLLYRWSKHNNLLQPRRHHLNYLQNDNHPQWTPGTLWPDATRVKGPSSHRTCGRTIHWDYMHYPILTINNLQQLTSKMAPPTTLTTPSPLHTKVLSQLQKLIKPLGTQATTTIPTPTTTVTMAHPEQVPAQAPVGTNPNVILAYLPSDAQDMVRKPTQQLQRTTSAARLPIPIYSLPTNAQQLPHRLLPLRVKYNPHQTIFNEMTTEGKLANSSHTQLRIDGVHRNPIILVDNRPASLHQDTADYIDMYHNREHLGPGQMQGAPLFYPPPPLKRNASSSASSSSEPPGQRADSRTATPANISDLEDQTDPYTSGTLDRYDQNRAWLRKNTENDVNPPDLFNGNNDRAPPADHELHQLHLNFLKTLANVQSDHSHDLMHDRRAPGFTVFGNFSQRQRDLRPLCRTPCKNRATTLLQKYKYTFGSSCTTFILYPYEHNDDTLTGSAKSWSQNFNGAQATFLDLAIEEGGMATIQEAAETLLATIDRTASYMVLRAQQIIEQVMPFLEQETAVALAEAHHLLFSWTAALWGSPIYLVDHNIEETVEPNAARNNTNNDEAQAEGSASDAPTQAFRSRSPRPRVPPRGGPPALARASSHRRRRLHAAFYGTPESDHEAEDAQD
ncbi:unnamed protein product [Symbiodinium sp. CCMP2592]|nr:unnamed protein product [Symbiodinium sp. CCMP2592]